MMTFGFLSVDPQAQLRPTICGRGFNANLHPHSLRAKIRLVWHGSISGHAHYFEVDAITIAKSNNSIVTIVNIMTIKHCVTIAPVRRLSFISRLRFTLFDYHFFTFRAVPNYWTVAYKLFSSSVKPRGTFRKAIGFICLDDFFNSIWMCLFKKRIIPSTGIANIVITACHFILLYK